MYVAILFAIDGDTDSVLKVESSLFVLVPQNVIRFLFLRIILLQIVRIAFCRVQQRFKSYLHSKSACWMHSEYTENKKYFCEIDG